MEIDELPSGTQDQKPDIDMNEIVGTHDILMLFSILCVMTSAWPKKPPGGLLY